MKVRTGAALAVVLVAAGAPAAAAKAKPVCQLVTDATGDATLADGTPNRAALDIVSADVATGARNLVGVVRLASVATDPTLATGVTYRLSWTAGGVPQEFRLAVFSDGTRVVLFDPNAVGGQTGDEIDAKAVVDSATSSITWTLPRKANKVLAKKGTKFSGLSVSANAPFNLKTPSASPVTFTGQMSFLPGDTASSGKTYTDLAPSCVKGV